MAENVFNDASNAVPETRYQVLHGARRTPTLTGTLAEIIDYANFNDLAFYPPESPVPRHLEQGFGAFTVMHVDQTPLSAQEIATLNARCKGGVGRAVAAGAIIGAELDRLFALKL